MGIDLSKRNYRPLGAHPTRDNASVGQRRAEQKQARCRVSWWTTSLAVSMAEKLTQEQVDECKEIFDLFDADEDGKTPCPELKILTITDSELLAAPFD